MVPAGARGSRGRARARRSRPRAASVTALPLLEGTRGEPFVVVSADIHTDFDFRTLAPVAASIAARFPLHAAHLVLVDNPAWHPAGDMALVDGLIVRATADVTTPLMTYANIAVFHPRIFDGLTPHRALKLFPWAYALADARRLSGSRHDGAWDNVGTPAQLAALDADLERRAEAKVGHG